MPAKQIIEAKQINLTRDNMDIIPFPSRGQGPQQQNQEQGQQHNQQQPSGGWNQRATPFDADDMAFYASGGPGGPAHWPVARHGGWAASWEPARVWG